MKKTFFAAMLLGCIFMGACGNKPTQTGTKVDTTEVKSLVNKEDNVVVTDKIDTVTVDSVEAVERGGKATDDRYRTFVKTRNTCVHCSCSGYWGWRHGNGTFEGRCSNSDGHGHTCGHSPQNHGLRAW